MVGAPRGCQHPLLSHRLCPSPLLAAQAVRLSKTGSDCTLALPTPFRDQAESPLQSPHDEIWPPCCARVSPAPYMGSPAPSMGPATLFRPPSTGSLLYILISNTSLMGSFKTCLYFAGKHCRLLGIFLTLGHVHIPLLPKQLRRLHFNWVRHLLPSVAFSDTIYRIP